MVLRWVSLAAKIAALAAIYVAVGHWGLQFDPVNRFATVVWPPAGLSLAALLLFGPEMWPGVAVGAVVVNLWAGATVPVAAGIALGNTLEALVGWYALRRIPGFRSTLDRLTDVLGFIGLAAIASTAVSAAIGVTSLWLGGGRARRVAGAAAGGPGRGLGGPPGSLFAETWFAWWQGDAIGDLIVAPFLLNWTLALGREVRLTPQRVVEACALGVTLLGLSAFLFQGDPASTSGLAAFRQPTTLLPLLIWAALRFGTRGATGATFVVSGVAIWSTVRGHGHDSLAVLQAFMSVLAVTCLVLSAVTAERARADRERTELYHRERLVRA